MLNYSNKMKKFVGYYLWVVIIFLSTVNFLRLAILVCGIYQIGHIPYEIDDLKYKHSCIFTNNNTDEDILLLGYILNVPLITSALLMLFFMKRIDFFLKFIVLFLVLEILIRFTFFFDFIMFD